MRRTAPRPDFPTWDRMTPPERLLRWLLDDCGAAGAKAALSFRADLESRGSCKARRGYYEVAVRPGMTPEDTAFVLAHEARHAAQLHTKRLTFVSAGGRVTGYVWDGGLYPYRGTFYAERHHERDANEYAQSAPARLRAAGIDIATLAGLSPHPGASGGPEKAPGRKGKTPWPKV